MASYGIMIYFSLYIHYYQDVFKFLGKNEKINNIFQTHQKKNLTEF